jgi:hypothetical protein
MRLASFLAPLAVVLSPTPGCRPPGPPAAAAAVPSPPPRFEEVAAASGLKFRWGHQGRTALTNLQSFGYGAAFFDYDGDGWLDVLLVGEPRSGLFRNTPGPTGRRFVDVSAASGVASVRGPWKGCTVGDWDDDADLDVVLTGYHTLAMLRSDGGRFTDVTAATGIRHRGWASSAGFADYDGDGDLDLYVGNYVVFGPKSIQHCRLDNGVMGGCPPQVYPAERGVLYRNDGESRFTDVTAEAGLGKSSGKTLAIGWCDYDDDGDPDLYLANDGTPGNLFRNDGGRFTDVGYVSGTALGVKMTAQAGMGVDWADYNRDGLFDLVVTAFADESFSLYRGADGGSFDNVSMETGVAQPTEKSLGFGCRMVDLDNDGWPDLVFSNGHVYDQAAAMDAASPWRQKLILMRGQGGKSFANVSSEAGGAFQKPIVGRGLAAGDYDNDGKTDLLVVDMEGSPLLLHNATPSENRVVRLRLVDDRNPRNRHAYGARVTLTTSSGTRLAEVTPVSSYLSASDPRLYFALAAGEEPRGLTVRWPGGETESFSVPAPDQEQVIHHGGASSAAVRGKD